MPRRFNVFGPIFAKELRVSARRKRNYWMRSAYLGLLTLVVCIAWITIAATISVTSAAGMMDLGMLAPMLLATCGWFQLFGLTLIAPILSSGSISEERMHRTLGVLLMTPITPLQIVAGKFLSRTLQLLLLIGLTLPVLATVQVFGGLETKAVISVLALCLAAGLFAGALGMLISTYSDRVYVTILNSYFLMLGLYLVVPVGLSWLAYEYTKNPATATAPPGWLMGMIVAVNPFITMFAVQMEMLSPGTWAGMGFTGWGTWVSLPCTAVSLGGAAVLTLLATWRVRRLARSSARRATRPETSSGEFNLPAPTWEAGPPGQNGFPETDSPSRRDAEADAGQPSEATTSGAARLRNDAAAGRKPWTPVAGVHSRSVGDNPVLWRELSQRIAGTSRWWWVGLVLLLLCLALVYAMAVALDSLNEEGLHAVVMGLFLVLILLEAGVFAAPTISSEKEASSWPILLSTTLQPRQILWSKAAGVMRRLVPISLLLVGHALVFTVAGFLNPLCLLHAGLIAASFVLFLIAVGLALSLRLERTTSAVVGTILTGLVLWAILPMVVGMLWGALDGGDEGFLAMISINPVYWMGAAAAGAVDSLRPGYRSYYLLDDGATAGAFTAVLFAVCGGYALAALAILASCIKRFNRLVGRPS